MEAARTNAELDALTIQHDDRAGERMLARVCEFLGRFVCYPSDDARVAHALWVVHAHMMEGWDSTPRIAFLSAEPGSGKTRAIEVTELLVPNPVCAVNVTPAYLFRKVGNQEETPTILYDEIDTVFGPKAKENEEIRGLLNAGHRKGAVAGRCVIRGKNIETEEIPAYCAVALAGIGWLPDTILTRSVIIRMRRRHAGEQVEQFRRRIHAPAGFEVRAQIELWAAAQPRELSKWPEMPEGIADRDADVWEPLLSIADMVGGAWPDRARAAAVALVAAATDKEPTLGVRLLSDLRVVFGNEERMATATILDHLHKIEEAPWSDMRGKPMDDRGLANRLRPYGVRSTTIWVGERQAKGYCREDLYDAWARYLPRPLADKSVTSVTSVASHGAAVTDVTHVTDLAGNRQDDSTPQPCACCHKDDGQQTMHGIDGQIVWLHRHCREPFHAGH